MQEIYNDLKLTYMYSSESFTIFTKNVIIPLRTKKLSLRLQISFLSFFVNITKRFVFKSNFPLVQYTRTSNKRNIGNEYQNPFQRFP